ncbi:hypothetical protein [Niastella sp.]|jgi:hypothetical protein|uniref:hypothetical protein n=1 Tax=Niastella sp. TaxID=1869183 RepID=UPI0038998DC2
MRIHRLIYLSFVVMILTIEKPFAQTVNFSAQEDKFVKLYSKLQSFARENEDSTNLYAEKFENEFTSFIKNNPGTLNYPFKKLIDSIFCFVKTSDDGNVRIYSWDSWTGGTMHFFKVMHQWRANGKVFTKVLQFEDGSPAYFCSKIFTINIKKNYYLAVTNGIFSTKNAQQSITCYSIEGNKLMDTVRLFKTKTKKLNTINVAFDFFSVVDRPERPLELITYDDKLNIIYIPVVDDKDQVTKKNILYQLKGQYFEFIGIETGKRK